MALCEFFDQLKNNGLMITLINNHEIDVTGDQTKIHHWLPVIKQHKKEIIDQLTKLDSDIERIRAWLFKIGESESDHYLVLEKCTSDLKALKYFLRHSLGEFE